MDLGLNHVVRKWSEAIDPRANMLISVPGGTDGPSGVLVCSENYITWVHQGYSSLRVPIPRRETAFDRIKGEDNSSSKGVIIVSALVHKLVQKEKGRRITIFFIFVQTEEGDIFKITMDYTRQSDDGPVTTVDALKIKYFDTIPVSSSICLLKSGFLFSTSEFGNHYLYQIEDLGDLDEEQVEFSSVDFSQGDMSQELTASFAPARSQKGYELQNIVEVDEMESLSPLLDAKVLNLTEEDSPQIYAVCGRGSRSTFRILRHGLEVGEMAVSELPGNPNAVWTVRTSDKGKLTIKI